MPTVELIEDYSALIAAAENNAKARMQVYSHRTTSTLALFEAAQKTLEDVLYQTVERRAKRYSPTAREDHYWL